MLNLTATAFRLLQQHDLLHYTSDTCFEEIEFLSLDVLIAQRSLADLLNSPMPLIIVFAFAAFVIRKFAQAQGLGH